MGEVIQVDDGAQLVRQLDTFLRRRLIGGEHDLVAGKTAACSLIISSVSEEQSTAAAFFLEHLQDAGGRVWP